MKHMGFIVRGGHFMTGMELHDLNMTKVLLAVVWDHHR